MKNFKLLSLAFLLLVGIRGAYSALITLKLQPMTYQTITMSIDSTASSLQNEYHFDYDFAHGETPNTYFGAGDALKVYANGGWFSYGPQYITAELGDKILQNTTVTYNGRKYYKYNSSEVDMYVSISQGVYDNTRGYYMYYNVPFTNVSNTGVAKYYTAGQASGTCSYMRDDSTWGITGKCDNTGITLTQNDGPAARKATLYVYFPKKPTHPVTLNVLVAKLFINTDLADSQVYIGPNKAFREYNLRGTITFPNSCRTSAATQDVDLQSVNPSQFTTKGALPKNYNAKEVTLTFTCDQDIGSSYGSMNWHVSATGPSINNESVNGLLTATATSGTINNLGVGLSSNQTGTTKIDATGAKDYQATVSGKVATAKFYAYPTMINGSKPSGAGDFKATATVMFDVP
jgi:hypothetical protein